MSYGRRVELPDGVASMEYFKENSVSVRKAEGMSKRELGGKIVVGKLAQRDRIEFTESLRRINDRVQQRS